MNKGKAKCIHIAEHFLRFLFLLSTLFPFYWLLITSFKDKKEISRMIPTFFPENFTLENYISAFKDSNFGTYILNSLYVTVISCTVVLIVAILGAYALSRFRFRGKKVTLVIFLVSQMVPMIVALAPLFILYSKLGWIDNPLSLIVTYTISNIPFCTITMSSFFNRIPVSLEEAAQIDGCNRWQAIFRIILPIMRPGIVAVYVFAFTGCWNELFYSIMMISKDSYRTIPAGLMNFVQKFDIDWGQMAAASIVTLIPVVIMFLLVQKHIVAGLTSGAVKE